ncbi:MAG: alginate lyase family protein, partial [Ferruginibacter sp.]|nr:alginate lyase family protein [Ferruginibacter sp.]
MKKISFVILAVVIMTIPGSGQRVQTTPGVLSLDAKVLETNKKRILAKDSALMPAYLQLISDAAQALSQRPVSVMEKTNFPPSGNKHDYMSIAPYFWPDSSKPGGVPYMNKDGQINPEVKEYMDKIYLAEVCEAVYTLGLAWYFSGEDKYARHAGTLLRTWFLDTATKMNPNLDFAQAVKGRTTGRGYGLIDTRHFVKLIDGIGLLQKSPCLSTKDQGGLQHWFTAFLDWMQTSKNGVEEMNTTNNHAVWYDLQRLCFA